jgi:hypothetical protein
MIRKPDGASTQPEVLAGLAAAARAGGKKPAEQSLTATPETAAVPANPSQEVDAATKVLREGVTKTDQGAAEAIRKLPDRAQENKARKQ